jgi:hypothetical protein
MPTPYHAEVWEEEALRAFLPDRAEGVPWDGHQRDGAAR